MIGLMLLGLDHVAAMTGLVRQGRTGYRSGRQQQAYQGDTGDQSALHGASSV